MSHENGCHGAALRESDKLYSKASCYNYRGQQSGVSDNSSARAIQIESDEIFARELQEQFYHENTRFIHMEKVDDTISWTLQWDGDADEDAATLSGNDHARSYAEKAFVRKPRNDQYHLLAAQQIWESVCSNDKKAVYQHIVASNADVNAVYEQTSFNNSLTLAKALLLQEQTSPVFDRSSSCNIGESEHWISALNSFSSLGASENRSETDESYEGFSLLHLACQTADIGMIELLLQYGANVNAVDLRMMSPLHHCILRGRHAFTKLLISRGADPHTTDSVGKTPLQYAMETGNIDDEALVILEDTNR